MDQPQVKVQGCFNSNELLTNDSKQTSISLEAEIPEVLYQGLKDFVSSNPGWDQYKVISSALASFLFQNGCEDRAVTEKYLNDLFNRSEI